MSHVSPFLAVGLALGYAVIVRPFLSMRGRAGSVVATIAATAVLSGPLLIAPEKVVARALAAVICGELFFKMVDYAREVRRGRGGRYFDYLRFLIPFPPFLVVFGWRERTLPRPAWRQEVARIVVGSVVTASCFAIAMLGVADVRASFVLDHAVKVVLFIVTVESASQAAYGLERLARFDVPPPMRFIFLARTPSDFWSRYNTGVHAWLDLNIFRPCGGRRAPVRGVLATFFVSAVFHELMFGIATSRFDGSQFAFFMIQAPAVLASPTLERFARRAGLLGDILSRGLTILWMAVTSVLFFRGVERVFPFLYAGEPWLR